MICRADLLIKGRVQGVFFRDWAKIEADKKKLTGWVSNDADFNMVSICVQGEKGQIEAFIGLCRTGPPSARVDDIGIQWTENPENTYKTFEIRH